MNDDKVECMQVAKRYDHQYWDGERRFGYGGYKFLPGRWTNVAAMLIETYQLSTSSKVLDLGCGKGYLLYELTQILPGIEVRGLDLSRYAIENSKREIKPSLNVYDIREPLPFERESFDLVISLGCLHNLRVFELQHSLKEIERVSKKSYVMVESYRNDEELFRLQCWALTAESFFDVEEWQWLFDQFGFSGDFEFIFF